MLLLVGLLVVFEVAMGFNNAIINASILAKLNHYWQRMFLTVGLFIAVVVMRLFFPIAIVVATVGTSFHSVIDAALYHPTVYAAELTRAHPVIAAFGSAFLLMLFLDFLIDEGKRVHWISVIERPLARAGKFKLLSTLFVLVMLAVVSLTLHGQEGMRVFIAGTVGLTIYLAVRFLNELCYSVSSTQTVVLVGRAALMTFIYLEVLDASFSLDSVVGAFAITDNVLIIALGLGIGALVVRQLTVLMVRKHALNRLIYLEHGAQYSVGGLAILLALGMIYNVSGVLTGLVGLVVIGLSVWSSLLVPKTA